MMLVSVASLHAYKVPGLPKSAVPDLPPSTNPTLTGCSSHETHPLRTHCTQRSKPQRRSADMTPGLSLHRLNDGVFAVWDAQGLHVGNLKRIGVVWKFKAVGYTAQGAVEPGAGPLTHRHNAVFEQPDATELAARLLAD